MDDSTLEFELRLRSLASQYLSDDDGVYSRITYMFLAKFDCDEIPYYASQIVNRLCVFYQIQLDSSVLRTCLLLLRREGIWSEFSKRKLYI